MTITIEGSKDEILELLKQLTQKPIETPISKPWWVDKDYQFTCMKGE